MSFSREYFRDRDSGRVQELQLIVTRLELGQEYTQVAFSVSESQGRSFVTEQSNVFSLCTHGIKKENLGRAFRFA